MADGDATFYASKEAHCLLTAPHVRFLFVPCRAEPSNAFTLVSLYSHDSSMLDLYTQESRPTLIDACPSTSTNQCW